MLCSMAQPFYDMAGLSMYGRNRAMACYSSVHFLSLEGKGPLPQETMLAAYVKPEPSIYQHLTLTAPSGLIGH